MDREAKNRDFKYRETADRETVSQKDKFYNLDILKTVAIILVILIHIVSGDLYRYSGGAIGENISADGISLIHWTAANIINSISRICVPIFVMVSGYLLLRKEESMKIFFQKRFIKLIPKFLVYSLIYYVYSVSFLKVNYEENFIVLLLKGKIFYHFWYVYMILCLYLVTPFFRKAVKNIDRKTLYYFVYIWIIFMVVVPLIEYMFKINLKVYPPVGQYIGYFVIGYLLGENERKMSKKEIMLYCLAYVIILGMTVYASHFFTVRAGSLVDYFYNYHSIGVFLQSLIVYKIIMNLSHKNDSGIKDYISLISAVTLEIYFIHPLIIIYMEKTLKYSVNYYLYIGITFIVTFILSFFTGYAIYRISKLRYDRK